MQNLLLHVMAPGRMTGREPIEIGHHHRGKSGQIVTHGTHGAIETGDATTANGLATPPEIVLSEEGEMKPHGEAGPTLALVSYREANPILEHLHGESTGLWSTQRSQNASEKPK